MDDPKKIARMFKALSVEARVQIMQMLKRGPLCVGALSARLKITQGAVSQHLRILRDADLVTDDKRGCFVHYSLNEETLRRWGDLVSNLLNVDDKKDRCINQCEGEKRCVEKEEDVAAAARSRRS
ncbi:MAG: helix-turn-helix transcriptional regulator [Candidatus Coatesbacteria bacterium]|nr:helix-turn-helix transcriptional regulator [Candidatus Coatesbacteria bacterium]